MELKIKNVNILGFLSLTINSISLLMSEIIIMIIIYYYPFKVIKIQCSKGLLKKFKFQDNEIEFLELENESYFDKYLNEVLYIFEYSDVDVIVFEDIDRYNTNIIFQRLREINETNKNLLIELKKKYWISNFSEKDGFYRISRKKSEKDKCKMLNFNYILYI